MSAPTFSNPRADQPAPDDTFDRSCRHWSEAGRVGMDAFYRLATRDYRLLAEAVDWVGIADDLVPVGTPDAGDAPVHIADIACGSGKFPTALLDHGGLGDGTDRRWAVDLLDPSAFSLDETEAVLRPPFEVAGRHEVRLEDWVPPRGFDLSWATHALYCVPEENLAAGAAVMRQALAPHGLGVVAQGHRDGHYVGFYDRFLAAFRPEGSTPYSDAEQVTRALEVAGLSTGRFDLTYETEVAADDEVLLERYLQRCAFDDGVSLAAMRRTEPVAGYLKETLDPEAGVHRFPQRVGVVFYAHGPEIVEGALARRRSIR